MRRVSATSLRTFVRNLTFLFHYRNSGLYGYFNIPGYPKPMQVVGKFCFVLILKTPIQSQCTKKLQIKTHIEFTCCLN
jgi:hypothetical protein